MIKEPRGRLVLKERKERKERRELRVWLDKSVRLARKGRRERAERQALWILLKSPPFTNPSRACEFCAFCLRLSTS